MTVAGRRFPTAPPFQSGASAAFEGLTREVLLRKIFVMLQCYPRRQSMGSVIEKVLSVSKTPWQGPVWSPHRRLAAGSPPVSHIPRRFVLGGATDCVKTLSVTLTVDRDPLRRFLSRRFASFGLVRHRENKLQTHLQRMNRPQSRRTVPTDCYSSIAIFLYHQSDRTAG